MKREVLKKNIEILNLDDSIIKKLKENNINIIEELWVINRHKLKDMNFKDNEINQIIIKLQLIGIDLNHKRYQIDSIFVFVNITRI